MNYYPFFDPGASGNGVDHHGPFPHPTGYGAHPQNAHPAGPWGADFPWASMYDGYGHGPWGRPGPHRGRGGFYGRHTPRGDVNMEDTPRTQTTVPPETERQGNNTDENEESSDPQRADGTGPEERAAEGEDNDPNHLFDMFFGRGGGRGGRGGWRRGGGHFRGNPRAHRGVPPFSRGPHHFNGPYDFASMMRGFADHPFFRNLARSFTDPGDSDTFEPPVDTFNTEKAFVLHVAIPGAKKEDIGVNWNPETSVLSIAGVVHRPGDEEFLKTLTSGERKVGVFERKITLPPPGAAEKEDVDDLNITAKMQDGILVITVPKVEKEWTEVRKVDIE